MGKKIQVKGDMFMLLHPANAGSQKYINLEKSLPKRRGLKSRKTRFLFVVELIDLMKLNNLEIIKTGEVKK